MAIDADRIGAELEAQRGPTKRKGRELYFRCFYQKRHQHGDTHPSARWNREKLTWFCDVCGQGGGWKDLVRRLRLLDGGQGDSPAPGVTLETLASARGLDITFLRSSGWRDAPDPWHGRPAIAIPYRDAGGQEVRIRWRLALDKAPNGHDGRFAWGPGDTIIPYGLDWLQRAREAGRIVLVEGETDWAALWQRDFPVLGIPGANTWRPEWAKYLEGIPSIYIWQEPDPAGAKFVASVVKDILGVKVIKAPPEAKDLSELAKLLGPSFPARFQELREQAQPVAASASRARSGFALTPLSVLLSEPEEAVSWLWEKTLPTGGFSLLASKPKVGKSTLARNLALAVATGKSFLGRATTQGPVVYLALEEKRREVAAHFDRMGATNESISVHIGQAPEKALEELNQLIRETRAALAIIDPLLRLVRLSDANDYVQVTKALEPLLMLARETGCHILVVHHEGKGAALREMGDGILGSTALFGSVDTALILRRRDDARTLESIQRYGEDIPRTALAFSRDSGALEATGTVEELDMQRIGAAILETLGDAEMTEKEVYEGVGGNTGRVAKALRRLLDEGKVTREGYGRKGDPFRYRKILLSPFPRIEKGEKGAKGETEPIPVPATGSDEEEGEV